MKDLGLARGTVRLMTHQASWQRTYADEEELLRSTLGLQSGSIQHVGSTAIQGILAKPILDIAIQVGAFDDIDEWVPLLEQIGYWYKGVEPQMPQRRFFAKGPEDSRTVYLHVVDSKEFEKMIKFRDALNKNPALAAEYSDLKETIAAENADDRNNYTHLKNNFISRVLNR